MSTKIYDAYRISKKVDILSEINRVRELIIDSVRNNGGLLKMLHVGFILDAKKKDTPKAKYTLEQHEKGEFDDLGFRDFLNTIQNGIEKNFMDIHFNCSIFYDDEYYYLKFYPYNKIQSEFMGIVLKEINLEDFHYQNQTDPPDDIDFDEFKKRDEKWDELLKPAGGTYEYGFQVDIFSADIFLKLIHKNYFIGKPLYEHLAYKFDIKFNIDD